MDAGHINDNEDQQLEPKYGTIALGIVIEDTDERKTKNEPPPLKIEGDVTPKGRQRYVIYFPSACEKKMPAGTAVMFDEKTVKLKGLGPRRIKIQIADNVRPFDPGEWRRLMKEMEENEQPQEQH
ncbi:MAG: hypothetical protein ACR2MT_14520 [Aurantibacter sp.]